MPRFSEAANPAEGPRHLLVNDEGMAALHYLDRAAPENSWVYRGAGRDLQLVGHQRLLRSHPGGFVELSLADGGEPVSEVTIADLPGPVESARRLINGHTVVIGNGGGGVFLWELDGDHRPVAARMRLIAGIDKARMVRITPQGTLLFCSETDGCSVIHELDWSRGLTTVFEVPDGVPADSMVKAVRVSPEAVTVSTGYAASLLRIDTAHHRVLQTIGGKSQPDPAGAARPLSPFFFSGYQMLSDGAFLIANWQGHSASKNGDGYQLLKYDGQGRLLWTFDQTRFPAMSSLNNVIALDGLDTDRLHDEPEGVLVPLT